jgi:hypothetical protein
VLRKQTTLKFQDDLPNPKNGKVFIFSLFGTWATKQFMQNEMFRNKVSHCRQLTTMPHP